MVIMAFNEAWNGNFSISSNQLGKLDYSEMNELETVRSSLLQINGL